MGYSRIFGGKPSSVLTTELYNPLAALLIDATFRMCPQDV